MKRYNNIYENICDIENIKCAHRKARKDKAYYQEVQMVDRDLDHFVNEIQNFLSMHWYEVSDYKVSVINDRGKERRLMKLPYYPDRIIQWAIMLQIEPIFNKKFCYHVCASLPKRGIKRAYNLTKTYLKDEENTKYCLKIDIRHFYESIDRKILKNKLRGLFKDQELLYLLNKIIDSAPGTKGVPIGSYLSQYFANFYLNDFDHWLKEVKGIKMVIRYMDDIIILHQLRKDIEEYLASKLNLELKSNYQVFPVESRGIDFVGYRFFHRYTLIRKKIKKHFVQLTKEIVKTYDKDRTITFRQWCAANSFKGWLDSANSYKLRLKYYFPILFMVKDYKLKF